MDKNIKTKKKKGNIMVVVAMILVIFPVILIASNMGGNSLKLLVRNKDYNQELLMQDSVALATKEAISLSLKELTFPMKRDSVIINKVPVYGNYYIAPFTTMDLVSMIDKLKNKQSLNTVFGISTINVKDLTYDENLTESFNKELPFMQIMNISCTVDVTKGDKTFTYPITADITFTVNSDITSELAYIAGINITNIQVIMTE